MDGSGGYLANAKLLRVSYGSNRYDNSHGYDVVVSVLEDPVITGILR